MVKISRADKRLSRVKPSTLAEANIQERYDLQEFIWNSQDEFCEELGEDLLIIGKEVVPSTDVGDRIDLLAVDGKGSTVILELKRGADKLQLYQAISYAGMVAGVAREDVLSYPGIEKTRSAAIDGFLAENSEEIDYANEDQRIILVAEAFDLEVLAGAQWLHNRYGVDITCVRVSMTSDEATQMEYLAFTPVFPTKEIREIAKLRGRRSLSGVVLSGPASPEARLTFDELLKRADEQKVRHLVDICRQLNAIWDESTSSGPCFFYSNKTPLPWRSLCKVFVSPEKIEAPLGQLDVTVVTQNLADKTGQDHDVIRSTLAGQHPQLTPHVKYCIIRLSTPAEAEKLVTQLKQWWSLRPQEQTV